MKDKENIVIHAVIIKKPYDLEEAKKYSQNIIKNKKRKFYRETEKSFRFRNIPKNKFIKNSFRTHKIDTNHSIIVGILKPEFNYLKTGLSGSGIFDFFKPVTKTIKNVITKPITTVKSFLAPRQGFNNTSTKNLNLYGSLIVQNMKIARTPILSILDKTINLISLGKWDTLKKEAGDRYDKLFHLALIADLGNKSLVIEKNEVINIDTSYKVDKNTEFLAVNLGDKKFTIREMLAKTQERMGNQLFWNYQPFTNNCQFFVRECLISEDLYTKEAENFLFQDLTEIAKKMPSISKKIMSLTTTAGGFFNKILGKGKDNDMVKLIQKFNNKLILEAETYIELKQLIKENIKPPSKNIEVIIKNNDEEHEAVLTPKLNLVKPKVKKQEPEVDEMAISNIKEPIYRKLDITQATDMKEKYNKLFKSTLMTEEENYFKKWYVKDLFDVKEKLLSVSGNDKIFKDVVKKYNLYNLNEPNRITKKKPYKTLKEAVLRWLEENRFSMSEELRNLKNILYNLTDRILEEKRTPEPKPEPKPEPPKIKKNGILDELEKKRERIYTIMFKILSSPSKRSRQSLNKELGLDKDDYELIKKIFEGKKVFDFIPTPLEFLKPMLESIKERKDETFLEPSCGLGYVIHQVLKVNPKMQITAYEVNHEFINMLNILFPKEHYPNITFLRRNFLEANDTGNYSTIFCNPPFTNNNDIRYYINFFFECNRIANNSETDYYENLIFFIAPPLYPNMKPNIGIDTSSILTSSYLNKKRIEDILNIEISNKDFKEFKKEKWNSKIYSDLEDYEPVQIDFIGEVQFTAGTNYRAYSYLCLNKSK
jgi:hypothetical protein